MNAESYLTTLCREIPGRSVGSVGNRVATSFFAQQVATYGFAVEMPSFDCLDWHQSGVELAVGGQSFSALVSPYSLGCQVSAPLRVVSTLDELVKAEMSGSILMLRGEIAREQLMPKNFTFYNPEEHQRIIRLLEAGQPLAILAATERNPQMVGAVYPFPLIEDGDFDIPNAYLTAEDGQRLALCVGQIARLAIRAQRLPAQGCNIIARKGSAAAGRVVLFAHIDAKAGTPGALDNAAGVATLLLLAERLANYSGKLAVEMVAMNGEDHYASPGEVQYLQLNAGHFSEIVLGVNLDGLGYLHGDTAYSLYDCPAELAALIKKIMMGHAGMVQGDAWYQGDHALFLMNQRPALAITSQRAQDLLAEVVHTDKDQPELINVTKLETTAGALYELVLTLEAIY